MCLWVCMHVCMRACVLYWHCVCAILWACVCVLMCMYRCVQSYVCVCVCVFFTVLCMTRFFNFSLFKYLWVVCGYLNVAYFSLIVCMHVCSLLALCACCPVSVCVRRFVCVCVCVTMLYMNMFNNFCLYTIDLLYLFLELSCKVLWISDGA